MSREFGSYLAGYFHSQIDFAAQDCKEGREESTKLWGEFLEEFYHIAYAVCSVEAGDWSEESGLVTYVEKIPELERKLKELKTEFEQQSKPNPKPIKPQLMGQF